MVFVVVVSKCDICSPSPLVSWLLLGFVRNRNRIFFCELKKNLVGMHSAFGNISMQSFGVDKVMAKT